SPPASPSQSPSPSPSQSPPASPSQSPSPSPSQSPSPSPSPTTPPGCWDTCTADSQCSSSLDCLEVDGTARCVNPDCPDKPNCICDITPAEQLPSAGIVTPTLILSLGGILLIILGLLL
ncbi:hypothetical protein ACFLZ1_01125, partial [Patescibacteria group bacterium]